VSLCTTPNGGWEAKIEVAGGGRQRLGRFATELEAARAYDAAARAQGVGGRANFPAPTAPATSDECVK
jgi:hypothetical protein